MMRIIVSFSLWRAILFVIAFASLLIAEAAIADPAARADPTSGATTATPAQQEKSSTSPPTSDIAAPAPADVKSGIDQPSSSPPKANTAPQNSLSSTPPQQGEKAETGPEPPKNLQPLTPDEAITILGKKVHGPDGKDVFGPLIDILVDSNGRPRAAIIDFGGFLGVGTRKIAVDWQLLKFRPADHDAPVSLSLDRAQIQAAPEYKDPAQPAPVVGPPPTASEPADAGQAGH